MFELDDDFDIDEVLDTVSFIEEEALRATTLKPDNSGNKDVEMKESVKSNELLLSSLKCPIKRKSDMEVDVNSKLPKRSSLDCLRLLESSTQVETPPHQESDTVCNEVLENQEPSETVYKKQSPKPTTSWKVGNAGNTSGCGMRTIATSCQRKFPGPAGLLPERTNRVSYALNDSGSHDTASQSEVPLLSQPTQSLDVGPWQALRCDLQDARDLLDKYTVTWVKQKVVTRRLAGQKIPFLAAVLHNIDTSSPDPIIVLRDKTGYINGTIHRSVWESHGGQLVQGSALVLRLVGVACTGSATQQRLYVNVTSNNIVTIYSPSLDGDVNVTEVHPLDIKEMRQRINEWETKCKADAALAANSTAQNSSLFSSVLDRTPLRQLAPTAPAARPPIPGRNIPPQRPANPNTNNRILNVTNTTPNPANFASSSGVVPRPSFLSRVPMSKPSNHVAQNKVVTSTQADNAEKISLDVSSYLEGLDTDLLFDDF